MRYNLDRGSHSVYSLHYHFVQCIKYRGKVLCNPEVVDFLKTKIHNISETYEVEVLSIECDKDHFHMIFTAKPTLDIPKYINTIKTITSREIRKEFPEVKLLLWEDTFWSRSYFSKKARRPLPQKIRFTGLNREGMKAVNFSTSYR